MAGMGASFKRGMVLALSLWDDYAAYALWLDSNYPADADPTVPGVARGPCGTDTGRPADVERLYPGATVTYSNIKWGELDSTYSGRGATTSNGPSGSTTGPVSSTSTTRLSTSSTRASTSSTRAPSSSTTVPTPTGGPAAPHWGQCGGKSWAGATRCESPYTCTVSNEYYSQCL
jgi:cellulose 1,4-beta-cellobiosidase